LDARINVGCLELWDLYRSFPYELAGEYCAKERLAKFIKEIYKLESIVLDFYYNSDENMYIYPIFFKNVEEARLFKLLAKV